MASRPWLWENEDRFCLLPIREHEVWKMYKQAEASFWTVEAGPYLSRWSLTFHLNPRYDGTRTRFVMEPVSSVKPHPTHPRIPPKVLRLSWKVGSSVIRPCAEEIDLSTDAKVGRCRLTPG